MISLKDTFKNVLKMYQLMLNIILSVIFLIDRFLKAIFSLERSWAL